MAVEGADVEISEAPGPDGRPGYSARVRGTGIVEWAQTALDAWVRLDKRLESILAREKRGVGA
ncbi:MAG: hypothetical protein EOM25_12595 [Deltaproteobacteria bacterium]|nr:hypothetical protein [Deltaproteobacteria bacterium]